VPRPWEFLLCRSLSLAVLCLGSVLLVGGASAQRRDSVVVTGVYEPVPLEEADRAVRVLDVERQRLLSGSIVDLLQLEPSVDLRRRAPAGVQTDVSIRGGTFGQTLVLLDGLRLNDAQTGHHNMDLPVPLEAISQVEILRGSGSTLYGSDAVGGVINLVTRPLESSELRLRGAAGNFGVNQQGIAAGVVRGRLAQQFSAARDFSSGFRPNRDFRNLSLVSNSSVRTGLGTTALLLGYTDRPFGADYFYGNYHSWERTKTWFGSLRQEFGARTQAAFAYRRHTDLFVLHRDRPEVFTNRHASEGLQAALRRREDLGGNTRLHYGVEGLRDSIVSTNLGRHSRASGAAYVALDVRALGRFSFSAGIREQIYGNKRSNLSPSLAAGFWLNRSLKLKASASRAFRLPSYTDLYYHDPASEGSPNLRPEKGWSFDAGVDWRAGARLGGEVTVFQRRETDGIDYVRRFPSDIWRATNIQRLRFTGVEASLTARPVRGHEIDLRYTALHGARAALDGLLSRYVFNYPSHAALAAWQATLPGKLLARARVGITSRLGRDPYAVADLFLARSGARLRPFLHLTNLSGTAYEEILMVPMPGRGIVGGLEFVLHP
jgi:iron complex outermembrane receptor protein